MTEDLIPEQAIDRIIKAMEDGSRLKVGDLLSINPEENVLLPCPLCGSDQIQFCGDRNNLLQAKARCRECKCTGYITNWQNRNWPGKKNLTFKMP